MNIILNPIGSTGDVNPHIGLGAALHARGHQVTVITNPYFEALIRQVGLDFVPLGTADEFRRLAERAEVWDPANGWKVAMRWGTLDTMRHVYDLIAERFDPGQTVVAAPCHSFGARVAHEKLGIPLATIHLEPEKLRSLYVSPVMPPPLVMDDWVPRISKRLQLWIADSFVIDPFVGPELNAWRQELNLPPVRRILGDWCLSPQCIIGLFPQWFAPPQPDWPAVTELTEFPIWDQSTTVEVPREVNEFLETGEPPLVFTAGTANKFVGSFFAAAVDCCRLLNRRGMLIAGDRSLIPADLPGTVRSFSYVPFSYVLDRAAALIHHAGIGTAAWGLAAGIPQLVCPMSYSQPDTAQRLRRLGVADVVKPGAFQGPRVARAIERLLTSQQVRERCKQYQQQMNCAHPFARTCELVESLVHKHASRQSVPRAHRNAAANSVLGSN